MKEFLLESLHHFKVWVLHMTNHLACINMIKQQLRTGDISNEQVLKLYDSLPREDFVPSSFKPFAYSDMQIPLAHGQRMMTPLEEARVLQALALDGSETVLEVGTGTGFLTAMLSRLSKKVVSVDYYAEFTANARKLLTAHQCTNVELFTGDAQQGWFDLAPYDVIVYTGSMLELTETQRLQLLPGGRLFAMIGALPATRGRLYRLDHDMLWHEQELFETSLPALVDKYKHNEFVF